MDSKTDIDRDRIRSRWSFSELPNLLRSRGVDSDAGAPGAAFLEGVFASLAEGYQQWVRPVSARLRPAVVRSITAADIPRCMEIQKACEGRFYPKGYREQFHACLLGGRGAYLVVERAGAVLGCGGIEAIEDPNKAVFHFDMIDPEAHGQGLGTALVLARVAMLELSGQTGQVLMNVPVGSLGFYRRLGFGAVHQFKDHLGNTFVYAGRHYKPAEVSEIRGMLTRRGVSWPGDRAYYQAAV